MTDNDHMNCDELIQKLQHRIVELETELQDDKIRLNKERKLKEILLSHSPDCIYIKNLERRFRIVNPRILELLGVDSADDVIGKRDEDFFPADLVELYRKDEEELIQTGSRIVREFERSIFVKTGEPVWFSTIKVPLKDQRGRVVGLLGINRDVKTRAALYNSMLAITSKLETEQLFTIIIEEAVNLVGADSGSILRHHQDQKLLAVVAEHNLPTVLKQVVSVDERGSASYVVRTGKSLLLPNYNQWDERLSSHSDDLETPILGSMITVPLKVDGKILGVLFVNNPPQTGRKFSNHDQELLEMLADAAAIAIMKADMMDRIQKTTDAAGIGADLMRLDNPLSIMKSVVDKAKDLFDADVVSCYLYDAVKDIILEQAFSGDLYFPDKIKSPGSVPFNKLLYELVREKEPLPIQDVPQDILFGITRFAHEEEIKSLVFVPLVAFDHPVGELFVNYRTLRHFTDVEIETSRLFGKLAGVALHNTQLYERSKLHHKQLSEAMDAARETARLSISQPLEENLKTVGGKIKQVLGCHLVSIYVYDQIRDQLKVPAIRCGELYDRAGWERQIAPDSAINTILEQQQPYIVEDPSNDELFNNNAFVVKEQIASFVAMPLIVNNTKFGVLFVNYRSRHEFDPIEIGIAQLLGEQVVMMLNGENRLRHIQRELSGSILTAFLHRINRLLSTHADVQPTLEKLRKSFDEKRRIETEEWIDIDAVFDKFQKESEDVTRLITNIGNRLKSGELYEISPVDISRIIDSVQEQLQIHTDRQQVSIYPEIPDNLPFVESNELQLRLVFNDMIENAIEAVKGHTVGEIRISPRFQPHTNKVQVHITDNGCGIGPEMRKTLFTIGNSNKDGRLGIGLFWCRMFMQATGGNIFLERTEINKGSTFVVEIPAIHAQKPANVDIDADQGFKDILIVEDYFSHRERLANWVGGAGYTFETARDYPSALDTLNRYRFRLALLDLSLTDDAYDKTGFRLVDNFDMVKYDIKVIFITAYGDEDDKQKALQNPRVVGFIRKGELDLKELLELIKQTLGH